MLFDPMQAAAGTTAPAIESVYFAPDGSRVAFTTQLGGSEDETLHVVDAQTGAPAADPLPHVGGGTSPTAVAWDGDARGFLHTQWPKNPDGSYATAGILIYHHELGSEPASDTYVFGRGGSPRAEYVLEASLDGRYAAASLADGDGVHATILERTGGGPFVRVAAPEDGISERCGIRRNSRSCSSSRRIITSSPGARIRRCCSRRARTIPASIRICPAR